jgi:hypothetical protein
MLIYDFTCQTNCAIYHILIVLYFWIGILMNMEFRSSELLETTASLQVSKSDVYFAHCKPYQIISVAVRKLHSHLSLGQCILNK